MSNMKEIFSRLRTPEGWQEKLYDRIETETVPKRRTPKKIAAVTAVAAALVCGVTVSAVEYYSWRQTLKTDFGDEISAAKLDSGAYQPLDISDSNELLSVRAVAFMGDDADSYVIAEARLGEGAPADFDRFGLNVIMYDESCGDEDIDLRFPNCFYGVKGPEEDTYSFRIRTVPYPVQNAIENNLAMTVKITGAVFEKDEPKWRTSLPAELSLSFTPDKSVLKEAEMVDIGTEYSLNGYPCTLEKVIFSEYCTRAVFKFYCSPEDSWAEQYGKMLDITNDPDADFDPDSCPVRLISGGEQVPFVQKDRHINGISLNDPLLLMSCEDKPDEYCFVLCFEPIDRNSETALRIGGVTVPLE